MTASKNWTLNATAAARKKFDVGVTGQSTTSTPWKFDSVSRRNWTAPGSSLQLWLQEESAVCRQWSIWDYALWSESRRLLFKSRKG